MTETPRRRATKRRQWLPFASLTLAALLTSCTTSVAGTAQPAPGEPAPQHAAGPCELLTPEQATGLGLKAVGAFTEGEPDRLLPPTCRWAAEADDGEVNAVTVALSSDITMSEYYDSMQPLEEKEIGGLRWESYEDPIASEHGCDLATELGPTSFAQVSSQDFSGDSEPCVTVEAATAQVAANLPGGEPAPPPVNPDAIPSTPLSDVRPCELVPAEKLAEFGYPAEGDGSEANPDASVPLGCEYTSGDPDRRTLYIALFLDKSGEDVIYESKEVEKFDTGGKQWGVYEDTDNEELARTSCSLILPYARKSAVKIVSGHKADPARKCETAKMAAEIITPQLPPPA